jgi:hypothetical protein
MNRERRSKAIFSSRIDFEMFLALLQDATKLWGVLVNAYCLTKKPLSYITPDPAWQSVQIDEAS